MATDVHTRAQSVWEEIRHNRCHERKKTKNLFFFLQGRIVFVSLERKKRKRRQDAGREADGHDKTDGYHRMREIRSTADEAPERGGGTFRGVQ